MAKIMLRGSQFIGTAIVLPPHILGEPIYGDEAQWQSDEMHSTA